MIKLNKLPGELLLSEPFRTRCNASFGPTDNPTRVHCLLERLASSPYSWKSGTY
jgi:hypothetical protein